MTAHARSRWAAALIRSSDMSRPDGSGVDRDLIRRALRLTPAERIKAMLRARESVLVHPTARRPDRQLNALIALKEEIERQEQQG